MEELNELELVKSYVGKHFLPECLWKVSTGSGNTCAVVSNLRMSKNQAALIGLPEELREEWFENHMFFGIFIEIEEETYTIVDCGVVKSDEGFVNHPLNQQELEVVKNTMEYVTKG